MVQFLHFCYKLLLVWYCNLVIYVVCTLTSYLWGSYAKDYTLNCWLHRCWSFSLTHISLLQLSRYSKFGGIDWTDHWEVDDWNEYALSDGVHWHRGSEETKSLAYEQASQPPEGSMLVNVDAAIFSQSARAGFGPVIHNHLGRVHRRWTEATSKEFKFLK